MVSLFWTAMFFLRHFKFQFYIFPSSLTLIFCTSTSFVIFHCMDSITSLPEYLLQVKFQPRFPCLSLHTNPIFNLWQHVISFNARGLRQQKKRRQLFSYFPNSKADTIILLQETHSCITDEQQWTHEWSNGIIFSHGSTNSRGLQF